MRLYLSTNLNELDENRNKYKLPEENRKKVDANTFDKMKINFMFLRV